MKRINTVIITTVIISVIIITFIIIINNQVLCPGMTRKRLENDLI